MVGESLLDDSVLNQALPSNPPRGWVHSSNLQDAADLWNGNNKAEAAFWNAGNTRLEEQFPETAGYSVFVNQSAIEHIKNNHSNAESDAKRGQTAITDEDISRITYIVSNYDAIASEPIKGTNNRRFAFAKQFDCVSCRQQQKTARFTHRFYVEVSPISQCPRRAATRRVPSPNARSGRGHIPQPKFYPQHRHQSRHTASRWRRPWDVQP